MGIRVFIGMPVGEAFIKRTSLFRCRHTVPGVRWVPPENLHVTLVPPWICDDVEKVCDEMQELLVGTPAQNVVFDRISLGPTRRQPRLVWVSGGVHGTLG